MENSVYLKDISCKIFNFLCNVVGSEKIVKNRRLFFKIMDDVLSDSERTVIASGSKAEGLDMKGSDTDIMIVIDEIPVYNCQSQIDNIYGLITDTENAAPGFVLMKVPHGNIPCPLMKYTYSEYGLLLTNDEFKQHMLQIYKSNRFSSIYYKIHGPCISTINDRVDRAVCLRSQAWPICCMKWLHRPMYSKWPTSNDVAKIAKEGLLYVPIGSKFGSKNENPLEWRISFSVPEKILVHSFNQAQFICYALLKIVLKEVINTNSQTTTLLCSYYMKTVMFWLAEESDPSSWNPETLLTCFQSCLDRLIYWVRIGYCPSYFIPENNMFEGKIGGKCQQHLLDFLTILRKEGLQLINRSATLCKFQSDNFGYNVNDSEAEDKAIYPLLYVLLNTCPYKSNYQMLRRIKGHLVKGCHLTKSLYTMWLMRSYCNMVETILYKYHSSNRHLYRYYKFLLSCCLIAKNIDVVSGGALLAAFFYRDKGYEKCLSVTNYALLECTPDKHYIHSTLLLNFEENVNNNSSMSFLQRHKLSCIHECAIGVRKQSVLHIERGPLFGPPNVAIHYLRFMCFHHLGDLVERNKCFEDIKLATKEQFLTCDPRCRFYGLFYWIKAAQVAKCWEDLPMEIFKSLNLIFEEDNIVFDWIVKLGIEAIDSALNEVQCCM